MKAKRPGQNARPFPKIVKPEPWIVSAGYPAHVNLNDKTMLVPFDEDEQARCVRNHELAHVKFSRPIKALPGTSAMVVQMLEDWRVNTLAEQAGISFDAGGPTELVDYAMRGAVMTLAGQTMMRLAAFPGDRPRFAELCATVPEHTERSARLADHARQLMRTTRIGKGALGFPAPASRPMTYQRMRVVAKWLTIQLSEPQPGSAQDKGKPRELPGGSAWGDAILSTGRITKPYGPERTKRVSDSGAVPVRWDRLPIDQAIFRQSRVQREGSVLIDISGSMRLAPEQVREICQQIPAGIVAVYSGNRHTNQGALTVVAKDGRMSVAPADYMSMGWNIIDGPALEWLAQQKGPRVWLSDGMIRGRGDTYGPELYSAVAYMQSKYRIARRETVKDVVAYLKTKR